MHRIYTGMNAAAESLATDIKEKRSNQNLVIGIYNYVFSPLSIQPQSKKKHIVFQILNATSNLIS